MKKKCALEALQFIQDGMIIGLGGGSTIAYLVAYLEESKLDVRVVTPSYQTAMLCIKHHVQVIPTWSVDEVDIAFDGCDEVDEDLNALKSGGAIHTKEKIIASMAKQYVLLVDESKVFTKLPFTHSVTIEIIPESMSYVKKQMEQLHGSVAMRVSSVKDGYTISDHGNFIMDVHFHDVESCKQLDEEFRRIVGIVDTSLLVDLVSFVLCANEHGVRVIK